MTDDFNDKLNEFLEGFIAQEAPVIEQVYREATEIGLWGVRVTRWVETDDKGTRLVSEIEVSKDVPFGKIEEVWK